MLERLSPNERAAFLLRSVFDYEYAEIAEVLGKSETSCPADRQPGQVALDAAISPASAPRPQAADGLAERFLAACRAGDVELVEQLFTEDVEVHSDGGGKVSAARVVIRGRSRAARFLTGVFSKRGRDREMHATTVNGEPGVVFTYGGAVVQVVSIRIEDGVQGRLHDAQPGQARPLVGGGNRLSFATATIPSPPSRCRPRHFDQQTLGRTSPQQTPAKSPIQGEPK